MDKIELALKIRQHSLAMTHSAKSSHIGSCLSCADILAVLYGGVMNYKADDPKWEGRDRFIMSKGHASASLYAVLAECGFFPVSELNKFYYDTLAGHVSHHVAGVEVSTGSLGMGLSIGCGMALASKQKVYVLLGDGDCQEGQTWEAAMFAAHHKLSNLVVIVDHNNMQALGKTTDVLNLESLRGKWESFGWAVTHIGGHNVSILEFMLKHVSSLLPTCIIADTVKGKGVSFMEGNVLWHYKYPNAEELVKALAELK
jgi:transketolase